ncbi:MAG TPA: trehalose-phosphatase [Methylomirabilota bacterium]|nr:trehalose-phosphatase [Methylomirabilota bacterium]
MLELDFERNALFLDFDGTLVDIAPRPEAVVVPAELPPLLMRLLDRFGGALAIVSGRPIAEIDRFLAPAVMPAAGLHGLEWRAGASTGRMEPPPSLDQIRRDVRETGLAERGVRIEDKGLSLALHYRDVPALGAAVLAMATAAAAAHPDLSVLNGKMVVEIKPKAASKASAVRRFAGLAPFAGRTPVFVGDDVTDEDGMRAALDAGGTAIKVGEGESVAPLRVAAPSDVHRWLSELAGR